MTTKKFDIGVFESTFYWMLYENFSLDVQDFNRKICYNGRVMRVCMEKGRIVSIVDLSGMHPVLLYSLEAVSA
jgi:hypothetical protein